MDKKIAAGPKKRMSSLKPASSKSNKIEKLLSQKCPCCGFLIGVIAGSKEAICKNCGFKDPCCE